MHALVFKIGTVPSIRQREELSDTFPLISILLINLTQKQFKTRGDVLGIYRLHLVLLVLRFRRKAVRSGTETSYKPAKQTSSSPTYMPFSYNNLLLFVLGSALLST